MVVDPGREGLVVLFLSLLLFEQNRVEKRLCIANPSRKTLRTGRNDENFWPVRKRSLSRCINWPKFCALSCQNLKILMCVLAPVRIFFVVCFERVRTNSVCGALSVRNGLNQGRFGSDNWLILVSDLGIRRGGCERRAITTSLPATANTYPSFNANAARHGE